MKFIRTYRGRIVLLALGLLLLDFGITNLLFYRSMEKYDHLGRDQIVDTALRNYNDQLDLYFDAYEDELRFFAKQNAIQLAHLQPEQYRVQIEAAFRNFHEIHPELRMILYGTETGKIFFDEENTQLPAGYDPRVRPWYLLGLDLTTGEIGYSDIYPYINTGENVISLVMQVQDPAGKLAGVLSIVLDVDDLIQRNDQNWIGTEGYTFITAGDKYLIHPDKSLINQTIQDPKVLSVSLSLQQTAFDQSMEGDTLVFNSSPNQRTGWVVWAVGVKSDLMKPFWLQIRSSLMASLLILFVMMFFIAFFSKYMTRELKHLAGVARAISRGDYSARVNVPSGTEISELAETFNQMVAQVQQKTAELQNALEILDQAYTRDALTGLPNRNAIRKLSSAEADGSEERKQRAVIFLNIDDFRLINDALGHREGDLVLFELAQKILLAVGDQGVVYRYGGDEFAILTEIQDLQQLKALAERVHQRVSTELMIQKQLFFITASIGISAGIPGEDVEQTIQHADTALYIAKREKNRITVYSADMDQTKTRETILESDMKFALEQNQFELYYQPIYDVKKEGITQAEALLRWNHPVFGLVLPGEFIPIAEKTRLIIPITDWVIRSACEKVKEWEAMGIQGIMVSVNLSFLSFQNRGEELTRFITRAIQETGIDASSLKLEITESVLIHDTQEVIRVFQNLKSLGVKLALDDFGTGYSSFEYMKDLPLDLMKLDRSLVKDITMDHKEQMIVASMVTIIHGLGLEVVVEGVETVEQLECLLDYDCDYIQGYLFSKPLPSEAFQTYYFSAQEKNSLAFARHPKKAPLELKLKWQRDWNCGNPLVDVKHQELMHQAERLFALIGKTDITQEMIREIEQLLKNVADHFEDEEKLLNEIGYPEVKQHEEEHKRLSQMANQLENAYLNGEIKPLAFFAFLVNDLIMDHLVEEDTKYFPYLKEHHG